MTGVQTCALPIFGISKVEMGFVDCGGRPVKKQRQMKRKKTKKKDTDEMRA